MESLFIKVAEMFGVFGKLRGALKGKKTLISSISGLITSTGAIVALVLPWIDGDIDAVQFMEQVKIPAAAFWVSATFLFSAVHAGNVIEKIDERKIGY